jgi:epoxyqueuosine reductase
VELVDELRQKAAALGFSALRVASAEPFQAEREALLGRISAGLFDGLTWFTPERAMVATDPGALVPGARSLITVAMPYRREGHEWRGGPRGRIARYAWSADYHEAMKERLRALRARLLELAPSETCAVVVDTGRVVDRAVAARAGLGWYGKNALILTPGAGSWVLLGEIVTTIALPPDQPLRKACGSCTRCLDECPTGAILAPGVVESRRCISYLTIEHRGWIPVELRPLMGSWIFGCDVCQEVCPVNGAAELAASAGLAAELDPEPELAPLLALTSAQFRARYGSTPVGRAGWAGFLRNVCVALGNAGDRRAGPALASALRHPEPLVRGHAAWAVGRLGLVELAPAVADARARERDGRAADEMADALARLGRPAADRCHNGACPATGP